MVFYELMVKSSSERHLNMDSKKKRTLLIVGIVEAVIIVFCLVISILVMVTNGTTPQANLIKNGQFIGTLQNNPTLFFCTIVLPLFVIFIVDGVYLIVYATKKESSLSDDERKAIEEQAKKEARQEVLKEFEDKAKSDTNSKK